MRPGFWGKAEAPTTLRDAAIGPQRIFASRRNAPIWARERDPLEPNRIALKFL
jgi:hypothetical protein